MELPVISSSAPVAEGGGLCIERLRYRARRPFPSAGPHPRQVQDHPCYSEEAHHYFARMHVAVAPACNIQCNYCNRKYDCSNESRPGVVSELLTPDQAIKKVLAVAAEIPQMTVLGIAGPGRPVGQPGPHLRDLPPAFREGAGHQALRVDQRPLAARARGRDRQAQHRPRDDHHQLRRSRDRRQRSTRGSTGRTSVCAASRQRKSSSSSSRRASRC